MNSFCSVAMEELARNVAQQYPINGNGHQHPQIEQQYSLRQNPQHYEHPEHWEQAKEPNIFKRVRILN